MVIFTVDGDHDLETGTVGSKRQSNFSTASGNDDSGRPRRKRHSNWSSASELEEELDALEELTSPNEETKLHFSIKKNRGLLSAVLVILLGMMAAAAFLYVGISSQSRYQLEQFRGYADVYS